MRSWAERLTRMRAEVEARAQLFVIAEPRPEEEDLGQRSRRGLKRSVPAHNPDRLSEGELRELRKVDAGSCRLSKKRHLKSLSDAEMDQIVAATKRPGWLMKDVAQQFNIAPSLVGKLCAEAERKPEVMARRRARRQLDADKRAAIEAVTLTTLRAGVPIVRAQ